MNSEFSAVQTKACSLSIEGIKLIRNDIIAASCSLNALISLFIISSTSGKVSLEDMFAVIPTE
jgi:hypothetical protein